MISQGGCIIKFEEVNKVRGGNCVTKVVIKEQPGYSMSMRENINGECVITLKKPAKNQTCMYCKGNGFIKYKSGTETCVECSGKGIVAQKT